MKCPNPNCGYDKIKPYQKVCPLCGSPITSKEEEVQRPASQATDSIIEPESLEASRPESQQRLCPQCSRPISEDTFFCPKCGFDTLHGIPRSAENPKEEVPMANPVREPKPIDPVEEPPIEKDPDEITLDDPDYDQDNPENGGYIPYPDPEPEPYPEPSPQNQNPTFLSWLIIILVCILSLLFGAILYIATQ